MANRDLRGIAGTVAWDLAQLEAILGLVPVAVAIVSSDGEIVFRNGAAEQLGLQAFGPDSPVARSLAHGEIVARAPVDLFVGRRRRRVEMTSAPIRDSEGDVTGAIAFITDLSADGTRARAERDFVTNAAHELQTPIAAIASAIEVLQAGAKDDVVARDRFLAHIGDAADRLARLTTALLTLARAQAREEAPRHEVIPVRELLQDVAAHVSEQSVRIDCPAALAVISNRPLLEQALLNLAENALKYGERAVLVGRRDDGLVAIDVRDAGPGIAGADQPRMFERFYRSERVSAPGFGLGLAIVREAVEAIGADLRVDSGPGGTTVSVLLPAATLRRR